MNLCFGGALRNLKKGYSVSRSGWNGKGMYVRLLPAQEVGGILHAPRFVLFTLQGTGSSWVPSSSDLMAEDWAFGAKV